jgi:hypothetical protein
LQGSKSPRYGRSRRARNADAPRQSRFSTHAFSNLALMPNKSLEWVVTNREISSEAFRQPRGLMR